MLCLQEEAAGNQAGNRTGDDAMTLAKKLKAGSRPGKKAAKAQFHAAGADAYLDSAAQATAAASAPGRDEHDGKMPKHKKHHDAHPVSAADKTIRKSKSKSKQSPALAEKAIAAKAKASKKRGRPLPDEAMP